MANTFVKVRERDKGNCRWCGVMGDEVHHIFYRSQGGLDVDWNLILLCKKHHEFVHSEPVWPWFLHWGVNIVTPHFGPLKLKHSWDLVVANRPSPAMRCCLACRYRQQVWCPVWEEDVRWDYGCDAFRLREGR